MEDEVAQLKQQLAEERRRRERAEAETRPQSLQDYLEACHSLSLDISVAPEISSTQGNTTDPGGRLYPRRIIPWTDFPARQEEIWDRLSNGDLSKAVFLTPNQVEYVKSTIRPIGSEIGLRIFERDVVELAVERLVGQAYEDVSIRESLGLEGTITFESHVNLSTTGTDTPQQHGHAGTKTKSKGNKADQFCIYRQSQGQHVPAFAIEYKPPHKLGVDEVTAGLRAEIQPKRDIINNDCQGFVSKARALAAAVITQLFSYMVGRGLQYGYVCTGETFVFLHIPSDPSMVYFSVSVPNSDVMDDDETRLHRTAVAQVFAFTLQALRANPPSES